MTLIERLEAAETGTRKLDEAIGKLMGYREGINIGLSPHYTTSIDAALTLVPEGWRSGHEDSGKFDTVVLVEAWCWPYDSSFNPDWMNGEQGYRSAEESVDGFAKTAALALCVAALKAREQTDEQPNWRRKCTGRTIRRFRRVRFEGAGDCY